MLDWQSTIAIIAIGISFLTFLQRTTDKALPIREHDEFRNNVNKALEELRIDIRHLRDTRPTVGELKASIYGINGDYGSKKIK